MRLRNHPVFFFLAILIGLSVGSNPVYARQVSTDAERQAIMDREMDCIAKNFESGGRVSWKNTCSSQHSSSQYGVEEFDDTSNYNDDGYSDYAQEKGAFSTYYQDESAVYTDWGAKKDYGRFDSYEENLNNSKSLHYSYGKDSKPGRFLQADLRLMGGWRWDDFNWNIASDITGTATPNILSELTWSDLKMTQLAAERNIVLGNRFVFDGMFSYADIYKGDNQDSDYLGDDRKLEFSRSNNNSSDGEAMDWSVGGGLRFYLKTNEDLFAVDKLSLTVLGGYSKHELNLIITEGFQTIPAWGAFGPTLHTSYWAEWEGPWLGFEVEGAKDKLFGTFRFAYHWADYYGSANWNLRPDFRHPKSFEHIADGMGLVFNLGASYHLTDDFTLDLRADIQQWEASKGIDRTFFSDGTSSDIRLNQVNWESKAFMLGSTYHF